MKYFLQLAVAFDQLANALIGGWADETISSRAFRQSHKTHWRIAYRVINFLFFWQKDHCYLAYLAELKRHQTFKVRTSPLYR